MNCMMEIIKNLFADISANKIPSTVTVLFRISQFS